MRTCLLIMYVKAILSAERRSIDLSTSSSALPRNTMGPKKGGGNHGGSKKSSKPQQEEISINDFVAAGEASSKDGKAKSKTPSSKQQQQEQSSQNAAGGGDGAAADQQKKPSARSVIGGASWTGKLPVNMLAEHCQKQKWEKPEYTMVWIIHMPWTLQCGGAMTGRRTF